ncbi:MAG: hypothetical protein QXS02_02205 [Candidatus Thermoplasmatota archaeon]
MKIVGSCSSYEDIKDIENIIKIFIVEQRIRSISPESTEKRYSVKNGKVLTREHVGTTEKISYYAILTVRGIS